jgi:tetratricopeptide (TPR) repeat protein
MVLQHCKRLIIPVGFAIACSILIIGVVWWQLRTAALHTVLQKPVIQAAQTIVNNQPTADPILPVQNPINGVSGLRQGDLLAEQGKWSEALVQYKEVAKTDGGLLAIRKVIQAELQLGQYEQATKTIKLLEKENAPAADIMLLQSIVLLRTGNVADARTLLDSANNSAQKEYGLMLLAIAEGDHVAAKQHIATIQEGTEPILRSNAGIIRSAYEEYSLFPESTDSHLITLLARALAQVQECALALPLVTQVTNQTADYRDAWIVRGFCELQTERFDEAVNSYQIAYNLDPQKVSTQYFLGLSYLYANEPINAITFFEFALTNGFTPASELHSLIATAANTVGNTELALQHLADLLTLEQTEEHFTRYIQTALQLQKSTQAYEQALIMTRVYPESANSFELLGLTAQALDNTEEATQAFTQALSIDSTRSVSIEGLKELEAGN